MSTTTRTYKSSIPLATIIKGADARVASTTSRPRTPNFFIPKDHTFTVQFLADPRDASATGWFPYRVASVKSILLPGVWNAGPLAGTPRADLPWSLRDVVVEDTEPMIVNGEEMYRFISPMMEVAPGLVKNVLREVLDGRTQNFAERDGGRTRVEWQVLTNVIVWEWPDLKKKDGSAMTRPDVGQHIGLRMSQSQSKSLVNRLIEKIDEAKEEGIDLNVLDYRWKVNFTSGSGSQLTLTRGKKITEPLEVEPYDFGAQIVDRMEAFEEHVKAAYADMNGPSPDEATDEAEAQASDPVAESEEEDLFSMITTSALRKRFKDADIAIPPGTSRSELIELAKQHFA